MLQASYLTAAVNYNRDSSS